MTPEPQSHHELVGWAVQHAPTVQAYERSTGEDIGLVLDRYRQWVETNLIGRPGEIDDESEAA